MDIPQEIFKAYDIRGVVGKTLTQEIARDVGLAIGSEARERGVQAVAVSRDGRISGPEISSAVSQGILAAGVDVIDIGMATTPMLYFAAHHLGTLSGVAVTGSHNPPDYNGMKIMLAGETLAGEGIMALYRRLKENRVCKGEGRIRKEDIAQAYFGRIVSDVRLAKPMRVAVDCGNGVVGAFAPALLRALGAEVDELFCDVDGRFPHHHPDPSQPKNLQDLLAHLRSNPCELGLAFDGDGDRLGVVTKEGEIIFADRELMIFAKDVLSRNPGAMVIYDVKCTKLLASWIREHGGTPLMWKTGHSWIKQKMAETGALLAGEMSGHIFFKERWYGFDDGLYAAARLLEILSREENASLPFASLPRTVATPELRLELDQEGAQHAFVAKISEKGAFPGAREIIRIDGVRVEYPEGFALVRASNTTPTVIFRFEADDGDGLARIQSAFREVLAPVHPGVALPF